MILGFGQILKQFHLFRSPVLEEIVKHINMFLCSFLSFLKYYVILKKLQKKLKTIIFLLVMILVFLSLSYARNPEITSIEVVIKFTQALE